MDIYCTGCGEPWNLDDAYHNEEMIKDGRDVLVGCPSCNGVAPADQTKEQREKLDALAEFAALYGDDYDGLAVDIEELHVLEKI